MIYRIILVSLALAGVLFTSGCMTRVGVEPAPAFIFDNTEGTMYVNPDMADKFNPDQLAKHRRYQAHKITIPIPYTFGLISFGWGDISTNQIMKDAHFRKLIYAHYRRLEVITVYQNYEITAYGE